MPAAERYADFSHHALCVSRVDVLDAEGRARDHATACWYRTPEGRLYLLTNWHVVTGRVPSNPALSRTGFVPVTLRVLVHARADAEDAIVLDPPAEFALSINAPDGNMPNWLEHPVLRHRCDVVAFAFEGSPPRDVVFTAIGDKGLLSEPGGYKPQAMHDAFVIGFPAGVGGGAPGLPIYKRGSIASDPDLDQARLPRFLIDCRTASGMSGSPVFCRHTGFGATTNRKGEPAIGLVKHERFMGVYSGRLKAIDFFPEVVDPNTPTPEGLSDIGVVWKESAIEQIIAGSTPGWRLSEI